jgi:hypothetical protein
MQRRGARAKPSSLVAKKGPVSGDRKPTTRPKDTSDPIQLVGVFPPTAGVGSRIEIFGSNFGATAKTNTVTIGGKPQKVVEAFEDRLVVQVANETSGPISVRKGAKTRVGARVVPQDPVKTNASFTALAKDGAFGRPRVNPSQGLIGTVYAIGKPSTEVPDFGQLGAPVTYIAVDNLDIAPGKFPQGFKQGEGRVTENYGVHFQGSLNVVEAGQYEICMHAGDGALFYLDQNAIVDLDGTGDSREKCESLHIEPGEYQLDLLWYQNDGEMGLKLSWSKDGGAKAPIPTEAFFPPEVAGLAAQIEGS